MDYILINGKIYTLDVSNPLVEALAIQGNRIMAVGTANDIHKLKTKTTVVIDLEGRTVLPGLNDSHLHFYSTGLYLDLVDVMGSRSIQEVKARIREYINKRQVKPGTWIRGRGWNHELFTDESRFITRQDLDEVTMDHPLLLYRTCGHVLVANSLAIKLAKLKPGNLKGEYDLEKGIFKEQAIEALLQAIPDPTIEEIKTTIKAAMKHANRYGITSVQSDDLMHLPSRNAEKMLAAFQALDKERKLTVRIYEQAQLPTLDYLKAFLERGLTTGVGSPFFKIGPLKLLADGSLGARTAALRKPYRDDPLTAGILNYSNEELYALVETAHTHRMQVAIHGIGDRAIEQIIDTYKKVLQRYPRLDHRHGIVHAQIMDSHLIAEMKALNLLAYVQPIFLNYDHRIVEARVGSLARTSYAYRTMKRLGIHVAYGTDSPVEKIDPMENIYTAVTRKGLDGKPEEGWMKEEAVTVEEAVHAYTVEGAYAEFMEDEKGKLIPNYLADLIVLNQDLFTVPSETIRQTRVLLTMVDGKIVYSNL